MPSISIKASDFRVLRRFSWQPEGVCLLAGANGAGKTTTLSVLEFVSALFRRGHEAGLAAIGGGSLQHLDADPKEPVELTVEVGEITWDLRFPVSATGLQGTYGEVLRRGDEVILRAPVFSDVWYLNEEELPHQDERCCAKRLWDRGDAKWMQPLVDALEGIRVHGSYWLNQVRKSEAINPRHSFLHGTGRNLWSVLANWKSSPIRYKGQYDWVLREACSAFPGILGTIEFDRGLTYLFRPGDTDAAGGLPPERAPDGLLTGLLHLAAVAGARDGAVIAFDEFENQLHPFAIRSLMRALREQAEERDLTIIMTTHSPVVMNEFRECPENLYVLTGGQEAQPVALDQIFDEDALLQVRLGELYDQLDFAAPGRSPRSE